MIKRQICFDCGGLGWVTGAKCKKCEGQGRLDKKVKRMPFCLESFHDGDEVDLCNPCAATGINNIFRGGKCPDCNGTGRILVKLVSVKPCKGVV